MTGYALQRGRSGNFERVSDFHRGSCAVGKVADRKLFFLTEIFGAFFCFKSSVGARGRRSGKNRYLSCVFSVREGSPYRA